MSGCTPEHTVSIAVHTVCPYCSSERAWLNPRGIKKHSPQNNCHSAVMNGRPRKKRRQRRWHMETSAWFMTETGRACSSDLRPPTRVPVSRIGARIQPDPIKKARDSVRNREETVAPTTEGGTCRNAVLPAQLS